MLSRFPRTLVYGVGVTDPLTFGIMVCALVLVSALEPARRTTRVDPLIALRAERVPAFDG